MKLIRWAGCLIAIIALAGINVTIMIDDDPWCCHRIAAMVQRLLQNTLQTPITLHGHQVRLIKGNILIADVCAQADDGSWKWHIGTMELKLSWKRFITDRKVIISCILHDLSMYSQVVDTDVKIMHHIQKLFQALPDNSPLIIDRVSIADATVTLEHPEGTISTKLYADGIQGNAPSAGDKAGTMSIHWHDGILKIGSQNMVSDISGTYRYDYGKKSVAYDAQATWDAQMVAHQRWYLRGFFEGVRGECHGGTISGSATIAGRYNTRDDIYSLQINSPLIIGIPISSHMQQLDLTGGTLDCLLAGSCKHPFERATLSATVSDVICHGISIAKIDIAGKNIFSACEGTIRCNDPKIGSLRFLCQKKDNHIVINAHNEQNIPLGNGYEIPSNGVALQSCVDVANPLNGRASYNIRISHGNDDNTSPKTVAYTTEGSCTSDGHRVHIKGNNGYYSYDVIGAIALQKIESIAVAVRGEPLLSLQSSADPVLHGSINYPLLSSTLKDYGIHLPGDGTVKVTLGIIDQKIHCSLDVNDATIRLPYTYNVLQGLSTQVTYNITERILTGSSHVSLHKGNIDASQFICHFNDTGALEFLHAPVVLSECLISWEKDLFSLISGALTIRYEKNKPIALQGFIVCDRSHARNNILSHEFQQHIIGMTARPFVGVDAASFNLSCMTRSPLRVQTSFLDCSAHVHLSCTGTTAHPTVGGKVTITHGSFLFPYKPLFIKRGIIYMTQQLDDPAVEIIAENSIKGYQVRLHVTGTAREPHITFESTPTLPEEQIIGLLWGGSEDGSLYLAMSTMIMQSLERLIFGPSSTTSGLQQRLQQLFRPLGNVRIVPSFTDQTGRGGLRGSLAIEVNDRLRGIIKQNFDLPEDTMYEVEYDVSDEVRMRAFKDERSDLGAEIEGRWKF